MEIISHRGYWKHANEKNTLEAFERSFSLGFGTETDVRDYKGKLVISHDMADAESIRLEDFLSVYNDKALAHPTLALNIKSDGLQEAIKKSLIDYNITNYFFFDMSIPDTLGYYKKDMNVFLRESEYEQPSDSLVMKSEGVWLDAFEKDLWYNAELIKTHVDNNKMVAIVSSELHHRDPNDLWLFLKTNNLHSHERIILCTDIPEDAHSFFK